MAGLPTKRSASRVRATTVPRVSTMVRVHSAGEAGSRPMRSPTLSGAITAVSTYTTRPWRSTGTRTAKPSPFEIRCSGTTIGAPLRVTLATVSGSTTSLNDSPGGTDVSTSARGSGDSRRIERHACVRATRLASGSNASRSSRSRNADAPRACSVRIVASVSASRDAACCRAEVINVRSTDARSSRRIRSSNTPLTTRNGSIEPMMRTTR